MEIAGLIVINLDKQLQNWYRRLPDRMTWKPSNVKTAPYSFFLLQSAVSCNHDFAPSTMGQVWFNIRGTTLAQGYIPVPTGIEWQIQIVPDTISATLQKVHRCRQMIVNGCPRESHVFSTRYMHSAAIRVARIFWQHRQRFDGRKIFITGIQHAGTASIALIAALAYQRSEQNCQTYIGYLEILSDAVSDMSPTYHPASRMDNILKAVLEQLRSNMSDDSRSRSGSTGHQPVSGGSSSARSDDSLDSNTSAPFVPVRREADAKFSQPLKKRWPSVYRQTSDFASSKPPFLGTPSQPTPSLADKAYGMPYGQQSQPPLDSILFPMSVHSQPDQLDLGLVGGNAVNVHHTGIASRHMVGGMNNSSISNQLSDNWGLPNLQPSFAQGHFHRAIDWTSGTAGLSASSVLNQNAAMSTGM
ncbi:hypothetical protein BKA60DRAFT_584747, partial [Fusarium oxysporum]